jgi:hypothetical protein
MKESLVYNILAMLKTRLERVAGFDNVRHDYVSCHLQARQFPRI